MKTRIIYPLILLTLMLFGCTLSSSSNELNDEANDEQNQDIQATVERSVQLTLDAESLDDTAPDTQDTGDDTTPEDTPAETATETPTQTPAVGQTTWMMDSGDCGAKKLHIDVVFTNNTNQPVEMTLKVKASDRSCIYSIYMVPGKSTFHIEKNTYIVNIRYCGNKNINFTDPLYNNWKYTIPGCD